MLAIGLMSGTSLDGIDAALIETDGEGVTRPVAFRSEAYSERSLPCFAPCSSIILEFITELVSCRLRFRFGSVWILAPILWRR